eukprot:g4606.t1
MLAATALALVVLASLSHGGTAALNDAELARAQTAARESHARGMALVQSSAGLVNEEERKRVLLEALPHLQLAVRHAPDSATYQTNLGVTEMRLGRVFSAKRRFARALAAEPSHAGALANAGWARDLQSEAEGAVWDERQGGTEEYTFGALKQEHELRRLPRIPVDEFGDARWTAHRNGELPFVLTGALTPARGWDLAFWSKANMTRAFAASRVDFYPHNMGDEKVVPLFTQLAQGWDELDFPRQVQAHVDASQAGTYIQWNVSPADWARMGPGIGWLPQLFLLDEAWLEECFADATTRESFFRAAHWRMLLIGERGAGMFNHKDTLRVSSWQVQLHGTKRWHLCHGDTQDPFMYGAGDVNAFAPDYVKYPLFKRASCFQEEVAAGEVIFYPRDYWHQTQNLEHRTMSLSGSIVDAHNWRTSVHEFRTECSSKRIMYPDEATCAALECSFALWEERFGREGAMEELKG